MYSRKARDFQVCLLEGTGYYQQKLVYYWSLMQKKYLFLEKSHMMEIERAVMIEHFTSAETWKDVKQQLPKLGLSLLQLIQIACIFWSVSEVTCGSSKGEES